MKILLIGGTGILGRSMVDVALQQGQHELTTVSLEQDPSYQSSVSQIIADRTDKDEFDSKVSDLTDQQWDVVFDIYSFDQEDARQTYELFGGSSKHVFVVSTTLVYDRSLPTNGPIAESHSPAKVGTHGGYVDHKLGLESFWHGVTDVNWTILRPYHILGDHSLIGCLPLHNRDPDIVNLLRDQRELLLCDGGNVYMSFVNPRDIARVVLKAAGNQNMFGKAYNVVHPEAVLAKNYYELLGELLGVKTLIKNKSSEEIWREGDGWELTTLDHKYSVDALSRDLGFVPDTPLRTCLEEALQDYPPTKSSKEDIPVHQRMNMLPKPQSNIFQNTF